eukprot:1190846-Prorocentrum_minimum.AAC.1
MSPALAGGWSVGRPTLSGWGHQGSPRQYTRERWCRLCTYSSGREAGHVPGEAIARITNSSYGTNFQLPSVPSKSTDGVRDVLGSTKTAPSTSMV